MFAAGLVLLLSPIVVGSVAALFQFMHAVLALTRAGALSFFCVCWRIVVVGFLCDNITGSLGARDRAAEEQYDPSSFALRPLLYDDERM